MTAFIDSQKFLVIVIKGLNRCRTIYVNRHVIAPSLLCKGRLPLHLQPRTPNTPCDYNVHANE